MNITTEQALSIAYAADLDTDDVRTDYSGRAMYGRECLGFIVPSTGMLLNLGMAIGSTLDSWQAQSMMHGARTDSMGMDLVIYFPDVQVVDE